MSCSECRGYNVSYCPCCSEPPPEYEGAINLFEEIRESVADGSITHSDDIQELLVEFSNDLPEDWQEGFDDLAWEELKEFRNLGDNEN